jgi:hypothetical protein
MRRAAMIVAGICLLLAQYAFGQTTGATVKVLDFTGASSCEQFDPKTATCQAAGPSPGHKGRERLRRPLDSVSFRHL